MRPRIDLDALDVNTPAEEVIGAVAMAGFSRVPVYEGDLDHIIGFVHIKDLFRQIYLGWQIELRKLLKPALFVPESMPLDRLLELFQEQHNQLAVVLDEYGGTEGMVTLEDVIDKLVGEIREGYRQDQEHMFVQRDENSWLVDGAYSIADLIQKLDLPSADADGAAPLQHHFRPDFARTGAHSQRRRLHRLERLATGSGRHGRPTHRPHAGHPTGRRTCHATRRVKNRDRRAFYRTCTEYGITSTAGSANNRAHRLQPAPGAASDRGQPAIVMPQLPCVATIEPAHQLFQERFRLGQVSAARLSRRP